MMVDLLIAFAAVTSLVNLVALGCIHYNLSSGYYRTRRNDADLHLPYGPADREKCTAR